MIRAVALVAAAGLLVAAAPVKLAPADDPVTLVGAAARAKNGIDPLAVPPENVGMAEDPAGSGIAPGQAPSPLDLSTQPVAPPPHK